MAKKRSSSSDGSKESEPLLRNRDQEPENSCGILVKIFSKRVITLVGLLSFLLVVAATNRVQYKIMLNRYRFRSHDYAYFLNQFTVVLYCTLAAIVVLYKVCTKEITREMRAFAFHKFLWMGLLDAASCFFGTIGGAYTAGQLQTLLDQSVIPLTMILSFFFMRSRYQGCQMFGASLICVGVGLATVPTFRGGSGGSSASGMPQSRLISILVYAFSSVPSAISNIYKEHAFKSQSLDIYYLSLWVSLLQFLWGFAFFPFETIPGFSGGDDSLPLQEIPDNLRSGFLCFLGIDTKPDDQCAGNYWIVLAYLLVNFIYNAILLLITKHYGALLLVMSGALMIPMTNFVFTLPVVMGPDAETFSIWDIAGLVVVVVGFTLYSTPGSLEVTIDKVDGDEGEEEEPSIMILGTVGHLSVLDVHLVSRHRHAPSAADIRESYLRKIGIHKVPSVSTFNTFSNGNGSVHGGTATYGPSSPPV